MHANPLLPSSFESCSEGDGAVFSFAPHNASRSRALSSGAALVAGGIRKLNSASSPSRPSTADHAGNALHHRSITGIELSPPPPSKREQITLTRIDFQLDIIPFRPSTSALPLHLYAELGRTAAGVEELRRTGHVAVLAAQAADPLERPLVRRAALPVLRVWVQVELPDASTSTR